MLRMGPVYAQDNGQGVSGIKPERTAKYRDLLYARTGIRCHRFHRLMAQPAGRGVGVPVDFTETPGGLQIESQELVEQHLYGHHKYGSYISTHQFPLPRCKLSNYYNCPVRMSTGYSQ